MDTKTVLGITIRRFRENAKRSQEQIAERAGITYQYLSGLENGRENFSIGVLESLAAALGTNVPDLVSSAYGKNISAEDYPKVERKFLRSVPLPRGLTLDHIADSLNETQRIVQLLNVSLIDAGGRALPAYIQKNNYSGIVSNILTDSFDRLTSYKHNHDQEYPDLIGKNINGGKAQGLEVKSTINIGKGGESHNGHSGWHLVACFKVDPENGAIRFIHAMFADLVGHTRKNSDWNYQGSKVNKKTGSQRTETYVTTSVGTTKLRDGSAYLDTDEVKYARWRPTHIGPIPKYSIFHPSSRA